MSDQIDYQIKGLDKLDKKLKHLQGKEIKDALHKTTDKAVKYVHSQVPEYPPPPPASTYRRTGTLGRQINTAVKEVGSEIYGVIGSPTKYSPGVISSEYIPEVGAGPQAAVHKGRWWTLQDVVKKSLAEVKRFYSKMLEDLIK